jgi:outer membrane protein
MTVFYIFLILNNATAFAAPIRIDLSQAIARAMEFNGEIAAERATVLQAEADLDRVGGEFGPKIEILAGVGPNFRASGDAVSGSEDKGTWGRTLVGAFSVAQPLYSFGRKSNYRQAAVLGKQVKIAGVKVKEQDVRLQVKEAYYGYLAAKSLYDYIQEGRADLEKAKAGKTPSKKEQLRMDVFMSQIDSKEAELKKNILLAQEALQVRLGALENEIVLPKEDWIDASERKLNALEYYLNLAQGERGEFQQLRQGILAKRRLAAAEYGAFFPVLAVLAKYDFADTNVRNTQTSPYAYDPYNRDAWTLGLGLKWDLQWGLPQAKAAKLSAEAEELEAKQSFAERGILLEVKRAFWDLEEANTRLNATTAANRASKKLLSQELMAYGSGLGGKVEDIATAYAARAEAVKGYYEAIYQQHLAWARLSHAVGQEVDPLLQ